MRGPTSVEAKPPANPVKKAAATEPAPSPPHAPVAGAAPKRNPLAAVVNNEPITRDELANECLLHYGTEVLESLVNRSLIMAACQQRNITITDSRWTTKSIACRASSRSARTST